MYILITVSWYRYILFKQKRICRHSMSTHSPQYRNKYILSTKTFITGIFDNDYIDSHPEVINKSMSISVRIIC